MKFKTADQNTAGTDADVFVNLYGPGKKTEYYLIANGVSPSGWLRGLGRVADFEKGSTTTVTAAIENRDGVRWRDVVSFMVGLRDNKSSWAGWDLEGVTLEGVKEDGTRVTVFSGVHDKDKPLYASQPDTFPSFTIGKPGAPPPAPALEAFVSAIDLQVNASAEDFL